MATEETYPDRPPQTLTAQPNCANRNCRRPDLRAAGPGPARAGSTTAKVASAGVVQSVGKLIGYASGILTLALTARLLTASDFGSYTTIAVVYLLFVAVIADIGIFTIAVREGSRDPSHLSDVYHTAFTLKAIAALIVYTPSFVARLLPALFT